MQNKFIHKNYYLQSTLAEELYHSYAKELPAVDFHNHLNPKDLADNKKFLNIEQAWVSNDPYKHRAMRIYGVKENNITGNASDEEKFQNWANTLPKALGNPLFLWSALELYHIFGIDEFLSNANATEIWNECNYCLQQDGYGTIDILKKFNVESLCTSDDLITDLTYHQQATKNQGIQVLPSLRADSILAFDDISFQKWFENLEKISNQSISNLNDYKTALIKLLQKFSDAGCRLADHALDNGFIFNVNDEINASRIFSKWLRTRKIDTGEVLELKNHLLFFLVKQYAEREWVLQLHIGAQRYTSSRLRRLAGKAGGFASIGNGSDIKSLCVFFDELEKQNHLPKVILYNLNPADTEMLAAITGSYAEDGIAGKIQLGPAWWYNDQYDGIRKQLAALANYSLLSQFIGMTTDSRSVFSFSRHEYFRRILCNQLAEWVSQGNLPNDIQLLSELVKDLCYYNCKKRIFNE